MSAYQVSRASTRDAIAVSTPCESPEEWRPVVGYEGSYEVSDLGRVRSLDRVIIQNSRYGNPHAHPVKGRLLRPGRSASGHLSVSLGRGNSRFVHTLVAEAFIGARPAGMKVRHLDGDEANNRRDNLTYGTHGENGRDKKDHKGAATYKMTTPDVRRIRARLARGDVGQRIAEDFGVSASLISAIKNGVLHALTY